MWDWAASEVSRFSANFNDEQSAVIDLDVSSDSQLIVVITRTPIGSSFKNEVWVRGFFCPPENPVKIADFGSQSVPCAKFHGDLLCVSSPLSSYNPRTGAQVDSFKDGCTDGGDPDRDDSAVLTGFSLSTGSVSTLAFGYTDADPDDSPCALFVWDLEKPQMPIAAAIDYRAPDEFEPGELMGLQHSVDRSVLVTGDTTGRVAIWKLFDEPPLNENLAEEEANPNAVTFGGQSHRAAHVVSAKAPITCMALSTDGKWLFTGESAVLGSPGSASIWDVHNAEQKHSLETGAIVYCVLSTSDSSTVFTGDADGKCIAWSVVSGTRLLTLECDSVVKFLHLSGDEKFLATGAKAASCPLPVHKCGGVVRCLALSPDGSTLVTGDYTGVAGVHEITTNRNPQEMLRSVHQLRSSAELGYPSNPVLCLLLSADGKKLFTGANGGACVYDVSSGTLERVLKQDGEVMCIELSDDNLTLFTGNYYNYKVSRTQDQTASTEGQPRPCMWFICTRLTPCHTGALS
jgi:WD40 repeat protein